MQMWKHRSTRKDTAIPESEGEGHIVGPMCGTLGVDGEAVESQHIATKVPTRTQWPWGGWSYIRSGVLVRFGV